MASSPPNEQTKNEAAEKTAEQHGIVPSRNITLDVPDRMPKDGSRPAVIKHM
jgi:hypothetical protein